MTTFVDALRTKNTFTENGMPTSTSSLSAITDLFFTIGAVRNQMKDTHGQNRIIAKFEAARNEDPLIARKLLFWARDIRGGAGEREVFRVILKHLAINHSQDVSDNIHLIAEFGRWDDLFMLFGTPCEKAAIAVIKKGIEDKNQLLAKWLPRLGGKVSSDKKYIANKVRNELNLNAKEYRKLIVGLTNVVETAMCSKDYSSIEYGKIPSLAMSRYSKAFGRNDNERFGSYLNSLAKGESKVNAGAVYPYDIIKNLEQGDFRLANEQWKALPNYMEGSKERILPVCDVSGSMDTPISGQTRALNVCVSLGLYISERNEGAFKDAFITFSSNPLLQYLTGDLQSRYFQLVRANWEMSTNIEGVFNLILDQALKHGIPESEMPTSILIMSDMEFNEATGNSNYSAMEMIADKYAKFGYVLPKIIFWNLNSRQDNVPVKFDEKGTALVSGFSPSILKALLSGESMSPIQIVLNVLNTERYSSIV